MMCFAPSSAAAHSGNAPSRPPSEYQCVPMRTCGSATGSAQEAARCCQVISEPRKILGFMRGSSVAVTANGIRGVYCAIIRRMFDARSLRLANAGSNHRPRISSGEAPLAIRYPLSDPIDAPTMRSGVMRSASTLQAPACHAPNKPPPDRTNARMRTCSLTCPMKVDPR